MNFQRVRAFRVFANPKDRGCCKIRGPEARCYHNVNLNGISAERIILKKPTRFHLVLHEYIKKGLVDTATSVGISRHVGNTKNVTSYNN